MAPNSHYCVYGRQSMMSVPSLVLIPPDSANPNDNKVLCSGKKNVNMKSNCEENPASVPEINVIPPSPRNSLYRKRWASSTNINTFDENEIHNWSMEGSEHVVTKDSSKPHSNTYVDNKNVTPFIIRRSPLKQVPSSKTEDIAPTKFEGVCKLNFNQVSMSDDSACSITTPTTPEVKRVFFPSSEPKNKGLANDDDELEDDIADDVFDEVRLFSPPDAVTDKVVSDVGGFEVDSNNNSTNQEDILYAVNGEDWPLAELTPEQEMQHFKIFCDKNFRESGGVTPVIGSTAQSNLSKGPANTLHRFATHNSITGTISHNNKKDFEGFPYNSASEQDKHKTDATGTSQEGCNTNTIIGCGKSYVTPTTKENLFQQPGSSYSYVTPPTQMWHTLVSKQKVPTPSPSQLCMQVGKSTAAPLWATPAVIKETQTQVLVCNTISEACPNRRLVDPSSSKNVDNNHVPSLWSTPAILKTDSSQQIILRSPAVQDGVYSSVSSGSQYTSFIRQRSPSKIESLELEKHEKEIKVEESSAPFSYMGVFTNIFKGIFGGLDQDIFAVNDIFSTVDIPVIYPHYEVAKGVPAAETEKKNE